ncbi:GAF and ANTAR domain-containing protein [Kineococcus gynurae]|uniref:GAF and ANTAR domain-containing protein n=1 Tax=Kineococcus gynurae TaxID=452979 RepID=A0ABV5LV67_9ACTN
MPAHVDRSDPTQRAVSPPAEDTPPPLEGLHGPVTLERDLARLSRSLHRQDTVEKVLDAILAQALVMIEGAQRGSIHLLGRRRQAIPAVGTDDVARGVDALQDKLDEGPCLDVLHLRSIVRSDDLARERRWPALATEAPATWGVRSVLSLRLYVEDDKPLGGLNLFSHEVAAFSDRARETGLAFSAIAATALSAVRRSENLSLALHHRDVIGQAKGVLMERLHVDADEAFALIAKISQQRNVKLHVLADEVARTGSLGT